MHSVKGVVASLVLLIGFLPTPARTQVVNRKVLAVDGTKQVMAATAKAKRVNAAGFLGAGTPTASSSSSATYFDKEKVAAGFAKGNPSVLFQGAGFAKAKGGGSNFEVHTSRHDGPAAPEVPRMLLAARSSIPRRSRLTRFVGPTSRAVRHVNSQRVRCW
jgi:hypothetical protein